MVANNQFAPLGLALLATLARVYKIVRAEMKVEVEKEEAPEAVVVVEEAWGGRVIKKDGLAIGPVTMEDFGEALKREEVMEEDEIVNEEIPEKEMVMIEKEIVIEREKEQLTQETTASEALLKVKAVEKTTGSGEENTKEPPKERKKRDGKVVKKKAMKSTSQSPLPPWRLSSPPTREETSKRKIKRKTDDKEGAKKKKKRKKGDEIDDLFAGLL